MKSRSIPVVFLYFFYLFMSSNASVVDFYDLTSSMEKLCVLEQNVENEKWLNTGSLKEEEDKLNNEILTFKWTYICFVGFQALNNIKENTSMKPLEYDNTEKLKPIFVNEESAGRLDKQVELCKSIFVEFVLDFKRKNVERLLASQKIKKESLSENQKVAIAMFVSQLDEKNNLRQGFSPFFVAGALNLLANTPESKPLLDVLLEKTPRDFLEGSDY